MIISHSSKFIFVHVQRTGGNTLSNQLIKTFGTDLEIHSQHGNAQSKEAEILYKHRDYLSFGFVRNPWERMFSWYSLLHKNKSNFIHYEQDRFQTFLTNNLTLNSENSHFHYNQLNYFYDSEGRRLVDQIYRYEQYTTSVKSIYQRLGRPLTCIIPTLNKTSDYRYQDYYTKASRALIQEECAADIQHFGYKFEEHILV